MAVHRRRLEILDPCTSFEGRGGWCNRCRKTVHDLSAMSEPQARRFLARHAGTQVCVSYRTHADGELRFRAESPSLGPLAVAAALTGCAGWSAEIEDPDGVCFDEAGRAIDCAPSAWPGYFARPDALPLEPPASSGGGGCPVPRAGAQEGVPEPPPPDAPGWQDAADGTDHETRAPGKLQPDNVLRVDAALDPSERLLVGVLPIDGSRLHFTPTRKLWRDFKERVLDRRAARQARRALRRRP